MVKPRRRLLFAFAFAVAAGGCFDPPPPPAEGSATEETPAVGALAAPAKAPPTVAAPAADSAASWQRLAQSLEAENRQLDQERDRWKAEAERYHAGLQRAVDELNRVSAAAASAQQFAGSAPASPTQREVRVHTVGAPDVQILGDTILVTGRLWNSGDAEATGRLMVELLANSRVIATKEQPLLVPGNGDVAFSERFNVGTPANMTTYSARVRPIY